MITETAQLLSNCHLHYKTNIPVYKQTHNNHPCSIWVRDSSVNYNWLYRHFKTLCNQYTLRYHKIHKTQILLYNNLMYPPDDMPNIGLTEFKQAMPEQYKDKNAVVAYRTYYIAEKLRFAKWSAPSKIPDWLDVYKFCIPKNILKQDWFKDEFHQGVVIV